MTAAHQTARSTTSSTDEYILTRPEAARLLGVSPRAITRMMRDNLISYRCVPGCRPRFRSEELESLASRSLILSR